MAPAGQGPKPIGRTTGHTARRDPPPDPHGTSASDPLFDPPPSSSFSSKLRKFRLKIYQARLQVMVRGFERVFRSGLQAESVTARVVTIIPSKKRKQSLFSSIPQDGEKRDH